MQLFLLGPGEALVDEVEVVSESLVEQAVGLFLEVEKTVAEGAGAAALAELLARPERYAGRRVGLILSGKTAASIEEVRLGSGGDTFEVSGTAQRTDDPATAGVDESFRTVTIVNAGAGSDTVTVSTAAESNGLLAVNLESGDDVFNAAGDGATAPATLEMIVFGGEGVDTIRGGQGNDAIFGDKGLVDYYSAEICLWDQVRNVMVTRSAAGDPRLTTDSAGNHRGSLHPGATHGHNRSDLCTLCGQVR